MGVVVTLGLAEAHPAKLHSASGFPDAMDQTIVLHLPAVGPGVSRLASLGLSFLIRQMG